MTEAPRISTSPTSAGPHGRPGLGFGVVFTGADDPQLDPHRHPDRAGTTGHRQRVGGNLAGGLGHAVGLDRSEGRSPPRSGRRPRRGGAPRRSGRSGSRSARSPPVRSSASREMMAGTALIHVTSRSPTMSAQKLVRWKRSSSTRDEPATSEESNATTSALMWKSGNGLKPRSSSVSWWWATTERAAWRSFAWPRRITFGRPVVPDEESTTPPVVPTSARPVRSAPRGDIGRQFRELNPATRRVRRCGTVGDDQVRTRFSSAETAGRSGRRVGHGGVERGDPQAGGHRTRERRPHRTAGRRSTRPRSSPGVNGPLAKARSPCSREAKVRTPSSRAGSTYTRSPCDLRPAGRPASPSVSADGATPMPGAPTAASCEAGAGRVAVGTGAATSVHHSRVCVVLELDQVVGRVAQHERAVSLYQALEADADVGEQLDLALDAEGVEGVEVAAWRNVTPKCRG